MSAARIALGIVLALSTAELAQAAEPVSTTTADVLFEQAREEMRRGDYAAAYPKLLESARIEPADGTLLNIIVCEEKLGKIASAWRHARELFERLPAGDERKPIAERKVAALASRLPRLLVRQGASMPRDTRVLVDDVELEQGSFGVPLPIDPGPHEIVVRRPGQADMVERLSIEEAQTYEWVVSSPPQPRRAHREQPVPISLQRTPSESQPDANESSRFLGWATLGGGVVALASAGVMGLMVLDRKASVERNCPPPERRCQDASGVETADEGQRLFIGTLIAAGVGAAGLGFGIYFLTDADSTASSGQPTHSPAAVSGVVGAYAGSF
jgi:hypothetical protein